MVGTLRACRARTFQVGNLRARMEDEGDVFLARVAEVVLMPDGRYSKTFESLVDMPVGDVLVIESLTPTCPWAEPVVAATIVADAVEHLAGGACAVVLPRVPACDDDLLPDAGQLLDADDLGEDLALIDTALQTVINTSAAVRHRLNGRSLTGFDTEPWQRPGDLDTGIVEDDDPDDAYEDDDEGEPWQFTARTGAVLRLALQDLSEQAWQEARALGDEVLAPAAAGVFADLPGITFGQGRAWRQQMARAFDDLVADITAGNWSKPGCTGEEMTLHLALAEAAQLPDQAPHRVARTLHGLPAHAYDCDRLVDHFYTAIAPLLDRPFGFFGHSMGALIAYQLTRRLLRQGEPLPTWLGVSAYAAPQGEAGADSRPHLMADAELRAWLRNGGGSPPQLLDNDDVWHKFAPVFRSDFKLVDTWAPPRSPEPLPVPLSAFAGVHDKLIDEDRLLAWRAFTTHFRGLERFDGDHFYLTTHQQLLAAAITAAMRSAAP